jgi:hypothetical protein
LREWQSRWRGREHAEGTTSCRRRGSKNSRMDLAEWHESWKYFGASEL